MIAICGGGNAGHALAVVVAQHYAGEVRWLVRSATTEQRIADALRDGGLRSTGVIEGRADNLTLVSTDATDVIPGADMVLIAAPAFAHADILARVAPHLRPSALIGCLPARSGFEFDSTGIVAGIVPEGSRRVFGLQTLPWSTRIVERGRVVNFGAIKAKVLMAALPGRDATSIAATGSDVLGVELVPTSTFLDMTLGNPGQFIHPGLMYGHFASWTGESFDVDAVPLFYADATDAMGDQVRQMSDEAVAVARSIEASSDGRLDLRGSVGVLDWLRMSYPSQTADPSTVATCFRTGPLQARRAPMTEGASAGLVPDFNYRYLSEDVPYGLVVTRAIAEVMGVPTPAIDRVIDWAQVRLGQRYLTNGRIDRAGTRGLPIPQHRDCETADDLVRWYVAR